MVSEKVVIEARTYSFPEVAHYMNRLAESEYVVSVELTGVEQIPAPDGRRMLYRFSIVCAINGNVGVGSNTAPANEEGGE